MNQNIKDLLSNYKAVVICLFFILASVSAISQTYINSPYSRYGIGQIHQNSNFRLSAMGGMGLAVKQNNLINISNPATYTAFDSTSFVFEGGIRGMITNVENKSDNVLTNNVSINYLLFGFPVSRRLSVSFGLLPYSHVGYTFSESTFLENIGDINYHYQGQGGLNRAYFGSAFNIAPGLSAGVNMSYIFGNLKHTRMITFPEVANIYSINQVNKTAVSDIMFDYGLHYHTPLNEDYSIAFALTASHPTQLNATQSILIESFSGVNYNHVHIKDTIEDSSEKGSLTIPLSYGVGVVLKNNNNWLVGADFKHQEWSKFEHFGIKDSLSNSMLIAIGTEYRPSHNIGASTWRRSTYRMGLKYEQTYLQLRNHTLKNYGISFGVGIPIQRSRSQINVGIELGQRGTTDNDLIKETYGMLTFSVSVYERWFVRRKLD